MTTDAQTRLIRLYSCGEYNITSKGDYTAAQLLADIRDVLASLDHATAREKALQTKVGQLEGEVARLRTALQPFADVAALVLDGLPSDAPDDRHVSVGITVRSLRAALHPEAQDWR